MNEQQDWWFNPGVPFHLKAEQNLFWLIYEENRRFLKKQTEGSCQKLMDTIDAMRAYAKERGWVKKDWENYVRKCQRGESESDSKAKPVNKPFPPST